MTNITTCPICSTQFIVREEHLAAHGGKVRCGQCQHVFDATKIFEIADTSIKSTPSFTTPKMSTESTIKTSTPDNQPQIENLVISTPFLPEKITFATDSILGSETFTLPGEASKIPSTPTHSNLKRICLALIVLALFIAGIAQLVYYFRNKIAAEIPTSKPYLTQACSYLNCKILPLAQIQSLVIDDSELQEDAEFKDVLQFSISIINNANIAVQYPKIELSLTNNQEETIIKRTFMPNEYLLPSLQNNIDAGIPAKGKVSIKLPLKVNATVAGYQLKLTD